MTTIDVGDGEDARDGLMTLVITIVEVLLGALEREAVRRMEGGKLEDEEIERLGTQLATIEAELEDLKRDEGIEKNVEELRSDLDGVVGNAIERLDADRSARQQPGYSVFGGENE